MARQLKLSDPRAKHAVAARLERPIKNGEECEEDIGSGGFISDLGDVLTGRRSAKSLVTGKKKVSCGPRRTLRT